MIKRKKNHAIFLIIILTIILGAVSYDSVVFNFRLNKAIYYSEKQNYEKSIQEYNKLLETNGQLYELYFNKAVVHAKNKDIQDAINTFSEAELINNQDCDLYYNLSFLYESIDEQISKEYLDKAIYLESLNKINDNQK